MSLTRLLAIARKELLQLRRDTRSLILAFLLPVLLLILFVYATKPFMTGVTSGAFKA